MKRSVLLVIAFSMAIICMSTTGANAHPAAQANAVFISDSFFVGADDDDANDPNGMFAGQTTCMRQQHNFPDKIAQDLNVESRNVSCAGATIPDMLNGRIGEPPQVDAIDENTTLVVLGGGGNHVGLTRDGICVGLFFDCTINNPIMIDSYAGIGQLRQHLDALYSTVAARAPEARVLVVGYPPILPRQVGADEDPVCLLVSAHERAVVNDLEAALNGALEDAALRFGFEFVDMFTADSPFWGRDTAGRTFDVCSNSPLKAINALKPKAWFHPTEYGVTLQYLAVKAALDANR